MNATHPAIPLMLQHAQRHMQMGQYAAAEQQCRQILALAPRSHDGLNMLGEIAGLCGQYDAAAALIGDAVKLKPSESRYLYNLGTVYLNAGRLEDAVATLRKAVRKKPDFVAAHANLAAAQFQMQQYDAAVISSRAALRHDRNHSPALVSLGNALRMLDRLDEAVTAYREALRLNPASAGLRSFLGSALREIGQIDEAEAFCREAIRANPDDVETHYSLAHLLLLTGRFQEGWEELEYRRKLDRLQPGHYPKPLWDGSPAGDRAVLLHAEEGLGDVIQFVRFAPLLAERARIVLLVPPSLLRLVSGLPGVEQFVTLDDPPIDFELQLPLMSAPRLLGTTLETIPAAVPYLHADPDQVAAWRGQLQALPGLRVGLAWAGSQLHGQDRRRSVSLAQLAPLADVPGVSFVSLQKGHGSEQTPPPGLVLHDWTGQLHDFADTAALVSALDLVITVDTSMVHLAGALGKPVWVLNRFDTDWRWLLGRDDSPWYPTLRLFRQPRQGDWAAVIQAVRAALAPLAAAGRPDDPPALPAAAPRPVPARPEAQTVLPPRLAAWMQQGVAEHTAGRLDTAETLYRQLLGEAPAHAETHHMLGILLHQTGRSAEAAAAMERAVALQPDAVHYRNNLGNILRDSGRLEDSCICYRKALVLAPQMPDLHHNLGKALALLGQNDAAEAAFRQALALRPDDFDTSNDLGNLLTATDRAPEALPLFEAALRARPDSALAYNNLGLAQAALHDHVQAAESFRTALRLQPAYAKALCNLGKAATMLREWETASTCYRDALRLIPDDAEIHVAYGALLLLTGRLEDGWPEFDWWKFLPKDTPTATWHEFPPRTWNGEDIGDATLVIYADQGFGDTIQFCRYLPLCAQRARVYFLVQSTLNPLLSQIEGVTHYTETTDLPDNYLHCPVNALPGIFRTNLQTIPGTTPYLQAEPAKAAAWRERLASLPGLKIGLVWAGNPRYPNDRDRSIPAAQMSALTGLPGVRFVSLQKGPAAANAQAVMPIDDWMDEVETFADTAALIEALDLVIGVDTAVVHLTGALGKPVWLLNRMDTDWRWLLDRDDSPWYPTLRQFRQTEAGEWGDVLARVRAALAQMVG